MISLEGFKEAWKRYVGKTALFYLYDVEYHEKITSLDTSQDDNVILMISFKCDGKTVQVSGPPEEFIVMENW